jgi:hypothetical protein
MARPRVFVSSTHYDLRHVRTALDLFIEGLGYDPILSEKGDIAYTPDRALDESCYREVGSADIFVLIVGGRYGSRASAADSILDARGHERYDSITRREFETAIEKKVPTYIFIESSVHAEYFTYLKNKDQQGIKYAHVDSVEIFRTIEAILSLPKNNPVKTFDRFEEISEWLREQWAGLFRELIHRDSTDTKIAELADQVSSLREINVTLKRYLESLVSNEPRTKSSSDSELPVGPDLIKAEDERLALTERQRRLASNGFIRWLVRQDLDRDTAIKLVESANSPAELATEIKETAPKPYNDVDRVMLEDGAQTDLNRARRLLSKPPFSFDK